MGLLALLSVLNARRFLVLYAVAIAAATALAVGLLLPKTYVATARVQVDSLQVNTLTGLFEPRQRVTEFLGQQAAVAGSRTVALQVYDRLIEDGFFVRDEFEAEWREKTGGELTPGNDARLWAADQLLKKLEISADGLESTIAMSFRGEDPAQAARVANAFATAYTSIELEERQRSSLRKAANFSEETRALELDVEDAQRDLNDFREETGIVGLGAQRLEDIEVQLATVTLRLAEARATLSEARSIQRQAGAVSGDALLTLPLLENMQAGRQAQARLGAVTLQLQRLAERYGDDYPPVIEARNEVAMLETTIINAIDDNAEFAERRVAALEATASNEKEAVLALQSTKQVYDTLLNKVDTSRQTFDLVTARSLQESLQSRVAVVEITMLARAVPPEKPAILPLPVIILLGAFVGACIGGSAAVAIELVEGRVRSVANVSHILRANLIAEISPPQYMKRRAA